ncbi:MAG: hypothetical protein VKJ04_08465 [Vampirovibrionales bacterium]|nr:hypothetical protein [Vampirovibrionales bacterium]
MFDPYSSQFEKPERRRRLKPGLQAMLYHGRQPVLILLAGSVIALAINFSLAQVHLSKSPDSETVTLDTARSSSTTEAAPVSTLNGFDLESDPKSKSLKITLKRGDANTRPIQIKQARRGNQYTLLMDKTQLSQSMVDNGLPVVIDNHNKLIGRAVPGHNVTQTKIIIPNMPSGEAYDVSVYEELPGKQARLLTPGTQNAQPQAPETRPQPEVIVANPKPAIKIAQPPKQQPARTQLAYSGKTLSSPISDAPLLRLSKQSDTQAQTTAAQKPSPHEIPQPRPAITSLDSRFERQMLALESEARAVEIASRQNKTSPAFTTHSPMLAKTPPLENIAALALGNSQAPPSNSGKPQGKSISKPKTGISIVESKTIAAADLPNVIQPQKPKTKGAITYIPHFGSSETSEKSASGHLPFWNPYVVKADNASDNNPETEKDAVTSVTMSAPSAPPPVFSSNLARLNNDPLWYLHHLPSNNQAAANSPLPLQAAPDLSTGDSLTALPSTPEGGLTLSSNPDTPSAPSSLTTGTIQVDNRLFHSIKEALTHMPIWFYIAFGLFFGGIGLFATLGSLVLLYQLVLALRQSLTQLTPKPADSNLQPSPQEEAKTVAETSTTARRQEIEAVHFADRTHVDASAYLNQSRTLNQQQAVRQAVKKSVLLQFPSHRAASKTGKKASNFVL